VGRNWYQSTAIVLVLGRWTIFFNFKGTPSWILQKRFCRHLSPNYLGRIGEALQIVYEVLHIV
jgi:hypothetical protein